MTHLDLRHNRVSDEYLKAIGSCRCITYLNLEKFPGVSDKGLGLLGKGCSSKTLKTLVLAGCFGITDIGVIAISEILTLEL